MQPYSKCTSNSYSWNSPSLQPPPPENAAAAAAAPASTVVGSVDTLAASSLQCPPEISSRIVILTEVPGSPTKSLPRTIKTTITFKQTLLDEPGTKRSSEETLPAAKKTSRHLSHRLNSSLDDIIKEPIPLRSEDDRLYVSHKGFAMMDFKAIDFNGRGGARTYLKDVHELSSTFYHDHELIRKSKTFSEVKKVLSQHIETADNLLPFLEGVTKQKILTTCRIFKKLHSKELFLQKAHIFVDFLAVQEHMYKKLERTQMLMERLEIIRDELEEFSSRNQRKTPHISLSILRATRAVTNAVHIDSSYVRGHILPLSAFAIKFNTDQRTALSYESLRIFKEEFIFNIEDAEKAVPCTHFLMSTDVIPSVAEHFNSLIEDYARPVLLEDFEGILNGTQTKEQAFHTFKETCFRLANDSQIENVFLSEPHIKFYQQAFLAGIKRFESDQ